jgi:hypothetical protein
MTERHGLFRGAGNASHRGAAEVAAADASRRHAHYNITWTSVRRLDIAEAEVARAVDEGYLHHRAPVPGRCGCGVPARFRPSVKHDPTLPAAWAGWILIGSALRVGSRQARIVSIMLYKIWGGNRLRS